MLVVISTRAASASVCFSARITLCSAALRFSSSTITLASSSLDTPAWSTRTKHFHVVHSFQVGSGQQKQSSSVLHNHFNLVLDNNNRASLYCAMFQQVTTTEHLCTVQSFQTGSGQQQSIPVLHNHFNLVLDNNNRASLYCAMFQLGPGNKNKESLYCAILSFKSWTIRPEHLHIVHSFQFGPG